jgi:hypothetical protein
MGFHGNDIIPKNVGNDNGTTNYSPERKHFQITPQIDTVVAPNADITDTISS